MAKAWNHAQIIQFTSFYPASLKLILIISYNPNVHHKSSFYTSDFPTDSEYSFRYFHACYMFYPSQALLFHYLNTVWCEAKVIIFLIMHSSSSFFSPWSKYYPQHSSHRSSIQHTWIRKLNKTSSLFVTYLACVPYLSALILTQMLCDKDWQRWQCLLLTLFKKISSNAHHIILQWHTLVPKIIVSLL
jgi:hypothetical protein